MSTKTGTERKHERDGNSDDVDDSQATTKRIQKRGRPRVENRDASAVERRRTQIRVAQRAYRARKDSTISELQAQVAELHRVVRDAAVNLQKISDKATTERQFETSTAREDLYQIITNLTDMGKNFEPVNKDSTSEGNDSPPMQPLLEQPCQRDPHLVGEVEVGNGSPEFEVSVVGHQILNNESGLHPMRTVSAGISLNTSQIAWIDPFPSTSSSADSLVNSTFASSQYTRLPQQILAMPTFSWQETTFARRLLRHSHETCLRHLENPSDKYADMMDRVRYSLVFMSQEALIQKLKFSVARSNTDPLEDWSMPVSIPCRSGTPLHEMLHIGGAGTHYELETTDINMDYRSAFRRNVGPFQLLPAALPIPSSLYPERVAEWLGLDGVWLDHRDTEAYLRKKGLKLDGAASTTVYEIQESPQDDVDSTNLSLHLSSWANDHTSGSLNYMQFAADTTTYIDPNVSAYARGTLSNGFADVKIRKVVLSIDRLVEKLNEKAVCLGRAPGYRQADVDEALNKILAKARDYVAA